MSRTSARVAAGRWHGLYRFRPRPRSSLGKPVFHPLDDRQCDLALVGVGLEPRLFGRDIHEADLDQAGRRLRGVVRRFDRAEARRLDAAVLEAGRLLHRLLHRGGELFRSAPGAGVVISLGSLRDFVEAVEVDGDERVRSSRLCHLRPVGKAQIIVARTGQEHSVPLGGEQRFRALGDIERNCLFLEPSRSGRVIGTRVPDRRSAPVAGVENDNRHSWPLSFCFVDS